MPLWVIATLIAAAAQTGRNAAQARLTPQLGTLGATQVRFLYGLPFALLFLGAIMAATGEALPRPGAETLGFVALGAVAQIAATALMLGAIAARGLATATAWIKTEPVILALTGAALLGDPLTLPAFAAIAIATAGVIVLAKPSPGSARLRPALMGLAAAALFGLSAVGFRGAILALPEGSAALRAALALVLALALQVALLGGWIALRAPGAFAASLRLWRSSLGAGALGAFASQFWFLAFALTSAANVRTLALVEVAFAAAFGYLSFGQRLDRAQTIGIGLLCLGVGLLLRFEGTV